MYSAWTMLKQHALQNVLQAHTATIGTQQTGPSTLGCREPLAKCLVARQPTLHIALPTHIRIHIYIHAQSLSGGRICLFMLRRPASCKTSSVQWINDISAFQICGITLCLKALIQSDIRRRKLSVMWFPNRRNLSLVRKESDIVITVKVIYIIYRKGVWFCDVFQIILRI
jgi:hypothetical protein